MPDDSHSADHDRLPAARLTRAAGEAVLLALAVLSPWPFGSVEPAYEFALSCGVLLLAALWAAHAALTGRFAVRFDLVTVCLAGIAAWSAVQLVPLPESVVGAVSPERLDWHRTLLPAQSEVLPGESGPVPRPTVLPLTVDPSATRTFLARVLGLLVVYAAARNWLATRESFPRLAWAGVANGVVLAVFSLGHFFSAPRGVVYWTIPVEGEGAFGPFICRNHYPDYVALCAGLGVGLLLPRRGASQGTSDSGSEDGGAWAWLLTPRALGLAGAVGLMAASVPFSLSRGGVLAALLAAGGTWLLARAGGRGRGWSGLVALAAVAAVGLAVAVWFGTGAVEQRLSTLGGGTASVSRLRLWQDSLRLVPGAWLAGTGGGTFVWAEPTVRTWGDASGVAEYAHNDYLEALVEGGAVRLALTVALAVGVLVVVGRGYLRRGDRSFGPLILGAWFGLAVVVLHAAGDFAVHTPAVSVLAAVVAGYAVAAANDPEFALQRVRVRVRVRKGDGEKKNEGEEKGRLRSPTAGLVAAAAGTAGRADAPPSLLFSLCASLLVAGAALFVALDARTRAAADRLKFAALRASWDTDDPDRLAKRAALEDERAAVRPDDVDALSDAALAHIDQAVEATWLPGAGLAGSAAGYAGAPDHVLPGPAGRYLVPALRYLRAARRADPLAPKPHARLGLYAGYFASSEPPTVHFDRAKRLLPNDPDVWFASGKDALRRGDAPAAWADWRRSLALAPLHLDAILKAARGRLTEAELIDRLLPDDPAVLMAAADELFPDRARRADERRPFAEAAVARGAARPDPTPEQLAALAEAYGELGRSDEAAAAWKRAVDAAPESGNIRDRYARWLEQDERYDDAVEQLEWLRRQSPGSELYKDRLDAARHGLKLQRDLAGD